MSNILISFNAIMPMFLLMALGYVLRLIGMISEDMIPKLNKLNFYVFLTALTFKNVFDGDLSNITSPNIIFFCMAGVLVEYFVGARLVKYIDSTPNRRAVLMQSFFRTNTLLMAMPLALALFEDVSVITIVFAFVIPLYNMLAAVAFEKDRGGKVNFLGAVLKNPIVISTLSGLILNLLGVKFPKVVNNVLGTLSTIGSGLPLIVLGANFDFSHAGKHKRIITLSCLIRLVIQPVIFVFLGWLCGFRGIEMLAVLVVFGCGVPTTTFTMAKEMGADAELAGESVVFSNLFSCLTLFLWIFALMTTGIL